MAHFILVYYYSVHLEHTNTNYTLNQGIDTNVCNKIRHNQSFILPWAYRQVTKWLRMSMEGTQFMYKPIIQFLLLAVEWALQKYKQYQYYSEEKSKWC